jgi:hypothetical protein
MTSKIDPHFIRAAQEGGETIRHPVAIELRQAVEPTKGRSRRESLESLRKQVDRHQVDVVNLLTSMGVKDVQVLSLSNSIKTSLTSEQLAKVAEHPDVKTIRLVKPEKVIT